MLSKISSFSAENSLAGFEFASGIPGTLGGAIKMNAGAYGGEMQQIVDSGEYKKILKFQMKRKQRKLLMEKKM